MDFIASFPLLAIAPSFYSIYTALRERSAHGVKLISLPGISTPVYRYALFFSPIPSENLFYF